MNDTLLQIEGLKTWLGDGERPVRAVDGIDLEIRKGETFVLLGESGCGKSMTALSIMRLLPTVGRIVEGSVRLGDVSLLDLTEKAMRNERGGCMGMIFQEPMTSLNPVLTIGRQIAEAVQIHDLDNRDNLDGRVIELLQAVGIPDPRHRSGEYPHQLSGGMKQRVMIAIALAGRPKLLIADEPTTALDVTIQAQVLTLLKDLQQKSGMAILLITHDLGVVAEVADRIAVMYAGQIVEVASCEQFFDEPRHPYSRKLFESLPGEAKRGQRLAVIKGTVPALDREFTGCRFIDRCYKEEDICRRQRPLLQDDGMGRSVRCHLADTPGPAGREESLSVSERGEVTSSPPIMEVEGLKVHFPIRKGILKRVVGHVNAVDGVSLSIASGRTLAVVGESGCGKTTVCKAILQLIRPTEGSVCFDGDELTRLKGAALRRHRADLQIIFQDPVASMNPRMLVGDIIAEGMLAQGIGNNRGEREQRVMKLLQQVGLPVEAAQRYPHEFSGGQRQRICVARALAVEPRLIVCDEPTSALDVSVQAQILNLLKELQVNLGLSYLFITHNISVVAYMAHEVAVMYLGRIVECGSVEVVLGSPRHPYTRALLSAVPVAVPGRHRPEAHLAGDVPSPVNPPSGCHFHPRCPEVTEECLRSYPQEVRLSDSHTVCCNKASSLG